jgi:hypothetical protein
MNEIELFILKFVMNLGSGRPVNGVRIPLMSNLSGQPSNVPNMAFPFLITLSGIFEISRVYKIVLFYSTFENPVVSDIFGKKNILGKY